MRVSMLSVVVAAAAGVGGADSVSLAGTVIYVDASAPPGGDGTSWTLSFADLHDGLAAAGDGDEVWVAAGTYAPAPPGGDRAVSFVVTPGVGLYGGFAGGEQSLEERDWIANETVLGGDLNGDDGPDFAGNGENSFNVVVASGADGAVIDGFTISGGHDDQAYPRGAGILTIEGSPAVRHCTLRSNLALVEGEDPEGFGAAIYCYNGNVTVIDCLFDGNTAGAVGGALRARECESVTIAGCRFQNNTADVGGGINIRNDYDVSLVQIVECEFEGNVGLVAGGAGMCSANYGDVIISDCTFTYNDGGFNGGGLLAIGVTTQITNSAFFANTGTDWAGAVGDSSEVTTYVNCVFSQNKAQRGGGVVAAASDATVFVNCTFSDNDGSAVWIDPSRTAPTLANCIVWHNAVAFNGYAVPVVSYSIVEGGGYPGIGNLDADPLFVQPGAGNVRLSFGSPAVNAGSNVAVPPDVQTDIDGNPRIQDGIVDMGAYEGEFEPLPPAAMAGDIDLGELVVLVPDGGGFDPLTSTVVIFQNVAGPDDATAVVTEHAADLHPDAEGYSGLDETLTLETSLAGGEFLARIMRPFGAADLGGADPLDVDLTSYDEASGTWALAVSANVGNSPGHPFPIGDRIAVTGPGAFGLTVDLGDYGVYWDPVAEQGFAWANVNHAADTGAGVALCPADVAQPPDGAVAMRDLIALLAAWGEGAGLFDLTGDGTVNAADLVALLVAWGGCE